MINKDFPLALIENVCLVAAQLISVGWGRKDTQFHGSEGKSAATRMQEVGTIRHTLN